MVCPRLVSFLLLLFTLGVPAVSCAQEDIPEVARSLLEEAERAKEAGRLDEAISKYQRLLDVAPTLASVYANLGAIYHSQGKVDEAYRIFVRGVAIAPFDRTLLTNAAATAQQLDKSAEALTYVDRALEKNPRDATLYSIRATILRSLGRSDEALTTLQQAVKITPDDPRLHFSLGNLLYQLGKKDEAIGAYRRAVELDHSYLKAYYNLGAVLFESGRFDEALQAYRVALEPIEQSFARHAPVDPIHARAYANLGAIYLNQKQYARAAEAYEKALRLAPNDASAHYNLGFIDYTTGKFDRAEEEYSKALASDPSLPLAYLHLGEIAFRRGDAERAIQILREGMPRFDRDSRVQALRIIGHAQLARSDRVGARTSLEEALRDEPNDAETLLYLGDIARRDQRPRDAMALLGRAQQLAPESTPVTMERVLAARDADDLVEERAAIDALLARSPNRSELAPIRAELVVVMIRQNAIDDARRALASTNEPAFERLRAALAGRSEARDAASTPMGEGNSGLLLWQRGRAAEARPHLIAAHSALPEWNEVTIALAEVGIAERRFDDATNLLTTATCVAPPPFAVNGRTLQAVLGKSDDLCGRIRQDTAIALVGRAADEVTSGSPRDARPLLDRAASMSLGSRLQAIVLFLQGTADLMSGGDVAAAREALKRSVSLGLPRAVEQAARKNLDAAQPQVAPSADINSDPSIRGPRRTMAVFLPDAPFENDTRLVETVGALMKQLSNASGIPLQTEFFRRADDARAFIVANRDRVGMVLSNPEFVASLGGELIPHFQFAHEGRQTYRRVIVVPENSSVRAPNDLRSRTVSAIDVLNDAGIGNPVRVPDDLTAIANVLYGKTDAAFVSEANPLLAQHTAELRVVYTTAPLPLPVVAFAPMPEADRKALDDALRTLTSARSLLAPLQVTALVPLERDPKVTEVKRDITIVPVSALELRPPEPMTSIALWAAVELPRIEIPEPKLP